MAPDKKYLTKKSEDISAWYGEVIEKAQLADYSPVKGFMIMRPNSYSIWEKIQQNFDSYLTRLKTERDRQISQLNKKYAKAEAVLKGK